MNTPIRRRNSLRLPEYDYSLPGCYFVTICTFNSKCVLGKIIHEQVKLSRTGKIVEEEWNQTTNLRPDIILDSYVIMPNHVHGIIQINEPTQGRGTARCAPTTLSERKTNKIDRKNRLKSNSLSTIIRSFKSAATRRANQMMKTAGAPLWQRNYYEHVIRNEDELSRIRSYIDTNPYRWNIDKNNPKNF